MSTRVCVWSVLWLCAGHSLLAAGVPHGSLLELHSCELYAGGCTVSSEAPQGGRYMVRAWQFTGGSFAGSDLTGLQMAVLQSSYDNLAASKSRPGDAVLYLPETATPAQRQALQAWLKSSQPDLSSAMPQIRTVPLKFTSSEKGCSFSAGDFVSVSTASLESCDLGGCGESLWYTPRAATTVFTVAVDQSSRVTEPLLKLTWDDAGKRSIFLGKFGDASPARDVYVTATDLCGPGGKLF